MAKLKIFHIAILLTFIAAPVLAQTAAKTDQREKVASRASSQNARNLGLLSRAEERAATLQTRLLELQMREVELQARIAELEYQASPESIQRSLVFVGSVRPMDELRDALRKRFEEEKARVSKQLELLTASRQRLEASLAAAQTEIQRLQSVVSNQ
jgi:hypothetical protein